MQRNQVPQQMFYKMQMKLFCFHVCVTGNGRVPAGVSPPLEASACGFGPCGGEKSRYLLKI